jgi:hypothetical protein
MKLVKRYVDVLLVVVARKVDEMLIVDAYCSRSGAGFGHLEFGHPTTVISDPRSGWCRCG